MKWPRSGSDTATWSDRRRSGAVGGVLSGPTLASTWRVPGRRAVRTRNEFGHGPRRSLGAAAPREVDQKDPFLIDNDDVVLRCCLSDYAELQTMQRVTIREFLGKLALENLRAGRVTPEVQQGIDEHVLVNPGHTDRLRPAGDRTPEGRELRGGLTRAPVVVAGPRTLLGHRRADHLYTRPSVMSRPGPRSAILGSSESEIGGRLEASFLALRSPQSEEEGYSTAPLVQGMPCWKISPLSPGRRS